MSLMVTCMMETFQKYTNNHLIPFCFNFIYASKGVPLDTG